MGTLGHKLNMTGLDKLNGTKLGEEKEKKRIMGHSNSEVPKNVRKNELLMDDHRDGEVSLSHMVCHSHKYKLLNLKAFNQLINGKLKP